MRSSPFVVLDFSKTWESIPHCQICGPDSGGHDRLGCVFSMFESVVQGLCLFEWEMREGDDLVSLAELAQIESQGQDILPYR